MFLCVGASVLAQPEGYKNLNFQVWGVLGVPALLLFLLFHLMKSRNWAAKKQLFSGVPVVVQQMRIRRACSVHEDSGSILGLDGRLGILALP
mgnify:CR=1 FL=1